MQVVEDVVQREAVLEAEREDDRLLVSRGVQLESEAAAETLAQGEAPGAVHAPAEGRMDHELHAARFVEEALEHHAVGSGDGAERALPLDQVVGELGRGRV